MTRFFELRCKLTSLRNRWYPTANSVLKEAFAIIEKYEQEYARPGRDDWKANSVAVFYARRAMQSLPEACTGKIRRAQIVRELVELVSKHTEEAAGLSSILGQFQDNYR